MGHGSYLFKRESCGASYGFYVAWTPYPGSPERDFACVDGFGCPEAARIAAYTLAYTEGWRPRRWWQWWRFGDTPNNGVSVEELRTKYKERCLNGRKKKDDTQEEDDAKEEDDASGGEAREG